MFSIEKSRNNGARGLLVSLFLKVGDIWRTATHLKLSDHTDVILTVSSAELALLFYTGRYRRDGIEFHTPKKGRSVANPTPPTRRPGTRRRAFAHTGGSAGIWQHRPLKQTPARFYFTLGYFVNV